MTGLRYLKIEGYDSSSNTKAALGSDGSPSKITFSLLTLFILITGCSKNPLMNEGFAPSANHDPFCTTCDTVPVLEI